MALANTNALCTLEEVKQTLALMATSEYDARLERLILAVSEHVERVCGRSFRKTAIVGEKFKGFGTARLYVARPPIDTGASTSISFDGSALASDDFTIEDATAGMIYREGGFAWTAPSVTGANYEPLAGQEQSLWTISYTGGYVLPNDTVGTRSLPYAIEEIAIQAVVASYNSRTRDRSVRSESLMSWSASYDDAASGFDGFLSASQREALAPFARVVQA